MQVIIIDTKRLCFVELWLRSYSYKLFHDTVYLQMAAWQAVLIVLRLLVFEASALSGKKHTLYLLSLLSYPNNNTSLEPSISDANDIIPGAYLAVSYGTPNWTKLFLPHRNDHDYRIDPLRSSDRLSS